MGGDDREFVVVKRARACECACVRACVRACRRGGSDLYKGRVRCTDVSRLLCSAHFIVDARESTVSESKSTRTLHAGAALEHKNKRSNTRTVVLARG
jgi:hypothetical protein